MADDNGQRPIIKKVKKVSGHGHHGGAWKVAYADFVTAMMAFFLMMWLLNATSEEQKKGLAEYFVQSVPLIQISAGGDSALSGDSMVAQGEEAHNGVSDAGSVEASRVIADPIGDEGQGAAPLSLEEIEEAFESLSGESDVADAMLRHIRTRVTEDGLVIDVFDLADSPLFEDGTATPTPILTGLLEMVGGVARLVTNRIAIAGHTGAGFFDVGGDDASWTLSADRAQTARRLLKDAGVAPERVERVTGHAGTEPLVEARDDPRNSRVSITLLR